MSAMIQKYPLQRAPVTVARVPAGSSIMSVQAQYNEPVLYVLAPDGPVLETMQIELYVTGAIVHHPSKLEYIGTVMLDNDSFVLHAYHRIAI